MIRLDAFLPKRVKKGTRPFILTLDFGLAYLGRYTHRAAISDTRILEVNDRTVRFVYRNRKDASKKKKIELHGPEFLRRFFPHTLPTGFTRIRHYGILGNGVRRQRLPVIRKLIGQADPQDSEVRVRSEISVARWRRNFGRWQGASEAHTHCGL